ncbi:hypothetical protein MMC17_001520 [Xylographa soralifera]|nr:hypothetical protein [Xylographa soralifera]
MTSTNFVFPPPPPPPPPPSASIEGYPSPSNQVHSGNTYPANRRGGQYGGRGSSSIRGWPPRGSRSGRSRDSSSYSNLSINAQQSGSRGGFNNQYNSRVQHYSNGSGQYPPQQYQAQHLQQNGYGQRAYGFSNSPYVPAHGGITPSNPHPSNRRHVEDGIVRQNATDASSIGNWRGSEHQGPNRESLYNTKPPLMGPPIRMGFPGTGWTNSVQQHGQTFGQVVPQSSKPVETKFPAQQGPGQQRTSSAACNRPRNVISGTLALPSVPEFGTAIAIAHPPNLEKAHKPRKKRKHNQLGLTPKTEDHESSEDEDVDEELKLAAVQASGLPINPGQLQFLYKGRLATLNSPPEIAAWIEERKKRFPTKKRIEEVRRRDHLRQAEREAAELRKVKFKRPKVEKNPKPEKPDDAARAKQKAEKLRKQYEKAHRRVVEMEAKANSAALEHRKSPPKDQPLLARADDIPADNSSNYRNDAAVDTKETSQSNIDKLLNVSTTNHSSICPAPQVDDSMTSRPIVMSSPQRYFSGSKASPLVDTTILVADDPLPRYEADLLQHNLFAIAEGDLHNADGLENSVSPSSSEVSNSNEDDTSSSGSSSEGDGPTEVTSKRIDAVRELHNKINRNKTICKLFLMKGYCPRGDHCHYLHELPKRGSGKLSNAKGSQVENDSGTREVKRERVTLYQRMLAQQQEREDEIMLQHIIFLGEHHILDAPK